MKTVIAVIKSSNGREWKEDIHVSSLETAEDEIRALLDRFNTEEVAKYKDKAHTGKFVKIVGQDADTCNWTKRTQCDEKNNVVYQCSECRMVYKIPHASLSHPPNKKCHPERVCVSCNYEYKTEGRLATHRRKKHGQES